MAPEKKLDSTFSPRKKFFLELNYNGFLHALLEAVGGGNKLPNLRAKLNADGMDFGKEDFMHLADNQFPAMITKNISKMEPIDHIDYIQKVLNEVGEPLTLNDWKTQFRISGTEYNLISYAAEKSLLSKVFTPEVWANRSDEMEELYRLVPRQHKNQIDFEALHTQAVDLGKKEAEKPATLAQGRTKPIILTSAHTGARYSPWEKDDEGRLLSIQPDFSAPGMPITPEEAIADAEKAYAAGARLIHMHARNPETGVQYADPEWYQRVADGIRLNCPGALISFPTSRKGEVGTGIDHIIERLPSIKDREKDIERRADIEMEIRASGMEARPDTLTTFTVPEMKILGKPKDSKGVEDVPGWTDPEVMQAYFKKVNKRARELGIMQEIEITTMGEFEVLKQLAERKDEFGLKGPLHIVLILGFSNGLPINRETYDEALKHIEELREKTGFAITVSCGAVIRPSEAAKNLGKRGDGEHDYPEVMNWVAEDDRVDAFRVGMEDSPFMHGKPWTNTDMVDHAREFFAAKEIPIETTPSKVRRAFNLPPKLELRTASHAQSLINELFTELPISIAKCGCDMDAVSFDMNRQIATARFAIYSKPNERYEQKEIMLQPDPKNKGAALITMGSNKKNGCNERGIKRCIV